MRILCGCHFLFLAVAIHLAPSSLSAQMPPRPEGAGVLSSSEYGKLLDRIATDLRAWDPMIRKVDPGKGEVSYKVGSDIAQSRELALREIQYATDYLGRQRTKRTVSGELWLGGFLESLHSEFAGLAVLGAFNDVTIKSVEDIGGELGQIQIALKNDGMIRLRLLEDGQCTH